MAAKKSSAKPKSQTSTSSKAAAKTAEPPVEKAEVIASPVSAPDAPHDPPAKPASEAKVTAGTVTETVSQRQAISDPTMRPDSELRKEIIQGVDEPQRPAEVVNPFPTLETASKETLKAAGKLPDGWQLVHAAEEKPVQTVPLAAHYRAVKTVNSTLNEQVAPTMDELIAKCEDIERYWSLREVSP